MKQILTVLVVLVAALAAVAQQQDFGQMDLAALQQMADGGNAARQSTPSLYPSLAWQQN